MVFWCDNCNVPVVGGVCGNCGGAVKREVSRKLRPVFQDELIWIGQISGEDLSLLNGVRVWANGRDFFVDGVPMFRISGGDCYNPFSLEWKKSAKKIRSIQPSTKDWVEANRGIISTKTEEARAYIRKVFQKFSHEVDLTTVAFSGGKDSSVILDLVEKTLGPEQYEAVFINTKIELPETLLFVEELRNTKKIQVVNHDFEVIELWKKMGPPSRPIRWCCSVLKTGPYEAYLRELAGSANPRVLTFEGIRKDESRKRFFYPRTDFETKILAQISARPIFEWSQMDVWLYIFQNQLPFNAAYLKGFERVGCFACPFRTKKDECFTNHIHPELFSPFLEYLEEFSKGAEIQDFSEYVREGAWKKRRGGKRSLEPSKTRTVQLENSVKRFEILERREGMELENLLTPLGPKILLGSSSDEMEFLIQNTHWTAKIRISKLGEGLSLEILQVAGDEKKAISAISYQVNKYAECVFCKYCQNICPMNAISIREGFFFIDPQKCVHCGKCVKFVSYGCFAKISKAVGSGRNEYIAASDFRFEK